MRDGLQWVWQIPPWCVEPWHGPQCRCPLRIASWVGFFPLCTQASFLPLVLHACTRHICQSQYLEYGDMFNIWLTSNRRGNVTLFSFTMALAAAVSGTTRVLCSYNYVIKNGAIVSLWLRFLFLTRYMHLYYRHELKKSNAHHNPGSCWGTPNLDPRLPVVGWGAPNILPRVPVAAEIACLEAQWNFQ